MDLESPVPRSARSAASDRAMLSAAALVSADLLASYVLFLVNKFSVEQNFDSELESTFVLLVLFGAIS